MNTHHCFTRSHRLLTAHRCEQRIPPTYGRLVVFSTTDFSFHGHPHPLEAPPGRARRSLALYFYTREFPPDDCENRNCSIRMRTNWQDPRANGMCNAPAPHAPKVTHIGRAAGAGTS